MLRTLPLLFAGLMVAGSAQAQTLREPTEVRVSIQGVDFANAADVARLYERLRLAAHTACNSDIDTPLARLEDRACAVKALDSAVQSMHQPALAAMLSDQRTIKVASNRS